MELKINELNFNKKYKKNSPKNSVQNNVESYKPNFVSNMTPSALGSIFNVRKSFEINKLKKRLIEVYDLAYEEMAQEAKELGINFVKPKLSFKHLEKGLQGCYISGDNEIIISSSKLSSKSLCRYSDLTYLIDKLPNGIEIPYLDFSLSFMEKKPKDCVYIAGDEKLYALAGTIIHELTHARQEQIMLSAHDTVEELYSLLKKKLPKTYKNISYFDFLNYVPFFANYRPLKYFSPEQNFTFSYPDLHDKNGEALKISYTPMQIATLKANGENNEESYYKNVMEIEARLKQAEFFKNYKKYLPDISIPDDIQSYYYDCLHYICQVML